MAAVARGNCEGFANVRVEVTSFEDWPLEAAAFHLVFAAQSWHWVDREVRSAKAADALVQGGTLALFWHRTDWHGEPVRDDLEELYRRMVPELHARAPGFPGLSRRAWTRSIPPRSPRHRASPTSSPAPTDGRRR